MEDRVPPLTLRAVFALGLLALGMAAAAGGYALFGPVDDSGLSNPIVWPPRWLFWAIWIFLYPATGVAAAWLWQARHAPDGRVAWRVFVVSMILAFAWVPIVQSSGSRLLMPVVMDALGCVVGLAALLFARRVSPHAFLWLLPVNIWGIATTVLKVWRLVLNW